MGVVNDDKRILLSQNICRDPTNFTIFQIVCTRTGRSCVSLTKVDIFEAAFMICFGGVNENLWLITDTGIWDQSSSAMSFSVSRY